MFEIESPRQVKLLDFNPRKEKHGPDLVDAGDLKLQFKASNDVLAYFSGHLKSFLYEKRGTAAQSGLEGVEPVSDMPNLRFPQLGTIAWGIEQTGMVLTVDYGTGGKSNLVIQDAKANAFRLDMEEGGTVMVTFRVQVSGVHEKELGKLCTFIGTTILMTLVPSESAQLVIESEAKKAADAAIDAARKTQGDLLPEDTPERALARSKPSRPRSKTPLGKKIAAAEKKSMKAGRRTSGRKRA